MFLLRLRVLARWRILIPVTYLGMACSAPPLSTFGPFSPTNKLELTTEGYNLRGRLVIEDSITILSWKLQSSITNGINRGAQCRCSGQHTANTAKSANCAISDEKAALIEGEQKLLVKDVDFSDLGLFTQKKAELIVGDLRGTCIFLVGMMGSGKTTVGKYIAEALGYYFFDSDKLVEDASGGMTVQQMFREGNEKEFRDAETEVLMQLSSMGRLVVATGGGAVVRPRNWGYLRHGIAVWLDVPVEALAKRVVAVGCESRPLLGQASPETAYHQALNCLENLFEQRVGYYKNADACVSVAGLATMMGLEDVSAVTPAMLAVQDLPLLQVGSWRGQSILLQKTEVVDGVSVLEEIAILMRNKRKSHPDHPGNF